QERLQRSAEGGGGFWIQETLHRDHAVEHRGQIQVAAREVFVCASQGAVGINHLLQMLASIQQLLDVDLAGQIGQQVRGPRGVLVGETVHDLADHLEVFVSDAAVVESLQGGRESGTGLSSEVNP